MTSFLIVHGWQNRRPRGHWQHWLAQQLEARGNQVCYPQLPDPDFPKPAAWMAALKQQLDSMCHTDRVVICHSLGCVAWLHLAGSGQLRQQVDRLVFVAPPSTTYLAGETALTAFQSPAACASLAPATSVARPRLVCSDNDPYCEEGAQHAYAGGFDVDMLADAGHLDIPAGYGPWPSILDWCSDPTMRITPRPDRLPLAVS